MAFRHSWGSNHDRHNSDIVPPTKRESDCPEVHWSVFQPHASLTCLTRSLLTLWDKPVFWAESRRHLPLLFIHFVYHDHCHNCPTKMATYPLWRKPSNVVPDVYAIPSPCYPPVLPHSIPWNSSEPTPHGRGWSMRFLAVSVWDISPRYFKKTNKSMCTHMCIYIYIYIYIYTYIHI